jgi:tetratricopeptide (TPR) repeat protein
MARRALRPLLAFLIISFCFLPASLMGQLNSAGGPGIFIQGARGVVGKVVTLTGDPIPGAMVEITNNFGGQFRLVTTGRGGEFSSQYLYADKAYQPLTINSAQPQYTTSSAQGSVSAMDIWSDSNDFLLDNRSAGEITFILAASKKGYRKAYKLASDNQSGKSVSVVITLRPAREDPALLSEADLVKAVAPRLREPGSPGDLPTKDMKVYTRGVQEFLDHNHPDRAVPLLDRVAKRDAACLRCRTMLGLAELSWGDWDDARAELGEAVNAMTADQHVGLAEPLLAYGVLVSEEHDPARAIPYFQEALRYSPRDALALQELGRAEGQYLRWDAASETLKSALAAGAGPDAHLLRAEALLWAGTADEAQAELDLYRNGQDLKRLSPRARNVAARIAAKKKDAAAFAAANARPKPRGERPLDYLNNPPQGLAGFEPARDQSLLAPTLAALGQSTDDLFKNLPNTSSTEKIRQEKLNRAGQAQTSLDQEFRYLCLMPTSPWGPTPDEYRTDSSGEAVAPRGLSENFMLTSGFVSSPLVFHHLYQDGSKFRYWGQQKINGSMAYVIAFAQVPARARLCSSFRTATTSQDVFVQGLVWVDASSYRILRLKTDLLNPVPQLGLNKQTTEINFQEVHFAGLEGGFWLPQEVTVTLDWSGRRLRNKHEYSDFKVFKVEQKNKIGAPKENP